MSIRHLFSAVLTVSGLLTLTSAACASDDHEGRPIADVMSWRGAPWLEREGRAAEEDTATLIRRMKLKRGHTVLDLGCGSGFHARRIAKEIGPTGIVVCVDLQPEMLEIARQLATRDGIDNIRFVEGAPDRVPAETGTVDRLLMVDVYHELARPVPVLADIRRVLAPKGQVALVEYRLEGDTAAHIKQDHRMSVAQVQKEWLPAGFRLTETYQGLPSQHLFLFRVDRKR